MANPEKVILKIISVKGSCAAKHFVGQKFDLSQDFILGLSGDHRAICPSAFHAIFPSWRVLRHGGEPCLTGQEGRLITELALAAHQSAELGCEVTLSSQQ